MTYSHKAGKVLEAEQAFRDYLAMGAKRSMAKLLRIYRARAASYKTGDTRVPTVRGQTLKGWSVRDKWQDRLRQMQDDQFQATRKQAVTQVTQELDRLGRIRTKALEQAEKGLGRINPKKTSDIKTLVEISASTSVQIHAAEGLCATNSELIFRGPEEALSRAAAALSTALGKPTAPVSTEPVDPVETGDDDEDENG